MDRQTDGLGEPAWLSCNGFSHIWMWVPPNNFPPTSAPSPASDVSSSQAGKPTPVIPALRRLRQGGHCELKVCLDCIAQQDPVSNSPSPKNTSQKFLPHEFGPLGLHGSDSLPCFSVTLYVWCSSFSPNFCRTTLGAPVQKPAVLSARFGSQDDHDEPTNSPDVRASGAGPWPLNN